MNIHKCPFYYLIKSGYYQKGCQVPVKQSETKFSLFNTLQTESLLTFSPDITKGPVALPFFAEVSPEQELFIVGINFDDPNNNHRSWLVAFDIKTKTILWEKSRERVRERWQYLEVKLHPTKPLLLIYLSASSFTEPSIDTSMLSLIDITKGDTLWSRELQRETSDSVSRFSPSGKYIAFKRIYDLTIIDGSKGTPVFEGKLYGMPNVFDFVPMDDGKRILLLADQGNKGGISMPYDDYELCVVDVETDLIHKKRQILIESQHSDRHCPKSLSFIEHNNQVLLTAPEVR